MAAFALARIELLSFRARYEISVQAVQLIPFDVHFGQLTTENILSGLLMGKSSMIGRQGVRHVSYEEDFRPEVKEATRNNPPLR